jgi:hypothetical protein
LLLFPCALSTFFSTLANFHHTFAICCLELFLLTRCFSAPSFVCVVAHGTLTNTSCSRLNTLSTKSIKQLCATEAIHSWNPGFRPEHLTNMALNNQAGGGAHSQPSLPALPAHLQSDTHLTAHLASRFHVALPTAQLSSHALICLNTYSSSTKGPDGGKQGSAMGGAEDLAERAWTRLGARTENQAIVFL